MQQIAKKPGLRISETRGEPFTAYGRQITPIGRVFQIYWPRGGYIRHRPVAIEVRQGDIMHRVPIRNATRLATASMMLIGLSIVAIGSSLLQRAKSRSKS